MNRNFIDSWNVIFDSHNKPLLGKLEFYEVNTTTLKTVFDIDGQQLLNPIYVNGRPDTQIMLGEGDYSVKFFEYIGHGDMRSDTNYSNWHDYKTILLRDDSVASDVTMDIHTVTTINDLKNLANMQNGEVIEVLGYYKQNDCPARYYVWHEESGRNDDGGIIIKSTQTTQGYWQMKIPGSYIDVRWYGDIPSNFASATSSNLGQRAKAATAANYYHKDLYFPSYAEGNALGFYMFDGSNTVSLNKDIICDNGVRFVIKPGTTGTKIQCHELHKCDKYLFISPAQDQEIGGYELECNWINTSWFDGNKEKATGARVGYIIDYIPKPDDQHNVLDFENTKIKFERDGLNQPNAGFDNCEFVDCLKNIDKGTIFRNMEIKQDWFADGFDFVTNCAFTNCKIYLENFKSADMYISMKNKQHEYNYGDMNESELHNPTLFPGTATSPCIIENFSGEVTLPTTGGFYEMHNASVKINGMSNNKEFNLVDCWLTIPANSICKSISMRRGALIGNGLSVLNSTYFDDIDISCLLFSTTSGDTTLKNCRINSDVAANNLHMHDCEVNAVVNQNALNGMLTMDVIGNKFSETGYYHPITVIPNSLAQGNICNNIGVSTTHHWVLLQRQNWEPYETKYDYNYSNNTDPYFDRVNDQMYLVKFSWTYNDTNPNPFIYNYHDSGSGMKYPNGDVCRYTPGAQMQLHWAEKFEFKTFSFGTYQIPADLIMHLRFNSLFIDSDTTKNQQLTKWILNYVQSKDMGMPDLTGYTDFTVRMMYGQAVNRTVEIGFNPIANFQPSNGGTTYLTFELHRKMKEKYTDYTK